MRRAGVSSDRPVVVYDGGQGWAAARAWWLLRWAYHEDVRVLDGGLAAWDGELTTEVPRPHEGDFRPKPGALPVLDADGAAALARTGTLLDARAAERYRGDVEPIDRVGGHIPGALSAPTVENVAEDGRYLPADRLADRFAALGVPADGEIGVYCGSGVSGAHEVLALEIAARLGGALPGLLVGVDFGRVPPGGDRAGAPVDATPGGVSGGDDPQNAGGAARAAPPVRLGAARSRVSPASCAGSRRRSRPSWAPRPGVPDGPRPLRPAGRWCRSAGRGDRRRRAASARRRTRIRHLPTPRPHGSSASGSSSTGSIAAGSGGEGRSGTTMSPRKLGTASSRLVSESRSAAVGPEYSSGSCCGAYRSICRSRARSRGRSRGSRAILGTKGKLGSGAATSDSPMRERASSSTAWTSRLGGS